MVEVDDDAALLGHVERARAPLAPVDPTEQGRQLTSEALELLQLFGAAALAGAADQFAPHALEGRADPREQLRDDRVPRIERQVARGEERGNGRPVVVEYGRL